MKVTVISFIFCILLISNVYALRINEVEVNPGATGKEWVELYNNGEEVNLSGWEVWEGISGSSGPKKINYNFSEGTIMQAGEYYIIEFNTNKLNNDGDFVMLYNTLMQQVDQTPTLNDSYADARTWQFCEGDWRFLNSTKGQENNCPAEEEIIPPENNENPDENLSQNTEQMEDEEDNASQNTEQTGQDTILSSSDEGQNQVLSSQDNSEKIFLSPKKSAKETFATSEGKLRIYAPYFFMVLIVILCIYLAFKKF